MAEGTTGTQLVSGRYETLLHLASGGMGSVYLARSRGELGFSRPVAVKVLHSALVAESDVRQRFIEEARVAARVKHPHVVSVLDVALDDAGQPFLVLDFIHGESLHGLLARSEREGEPVPLEVVSAILGDALEGLHAAHEAVDDGGESLELVHRDVSPQNILVDVHGAAYIADFGVAKVKDGLRITHGGLVGKPGYLSPEQLEREAVGRRGDVYAAGIVLWEAVTGTRLHPTLEGQVHAHVTRAPIEAPSARRPEVPPALDDLVRAMLERDPARRPATALAAREALQKAVPRASSKVVGEWVIALAQARLDRIQAALRAPPAPLEATVARSSPDEGAATLRDDAALPRLPDGSEVSSGGTGRGRARRRLLTFIVGGAALVTLLTIGVELFAGRPSTRNLPPPIPSVTVAPPEVRAEPVATSEPPPPPAPTASVAGPRRMAPPARPKVSCDPPWVLENGVKRYNRDCFPAR